MDVDNLPECLHFLLVLISHANHEHIKLGLWESVCKYERRAVSLKLFTLLDIVKCDILLLLLLTPTHLHHIYIQW